MKHTVGFSGGIDSQACALWVRQNVPIEDVILMNSDAGGNEHPLTTEFIREYSERVFPVQTVTSIVADMGNYAAKKIAERGLKPDDPLTFGLLAELKGRFPSAMAQFCTEFVKMRPLRRLTNQLCPDGDFVRYAGIRRDESRRRRARQPVEYDDFFDCELRLPLLDWKKQQCFDFVIAAGEPVNPLYSMGFKRVGCAPCINSGKADILNWAQRFPEMIDKVRRWEQAVGRTYFFLPLDDGKTFGFVDRVVQWSGTTHGGKQMSLRVLQTPEACESSFGLCE